LGEQNLLEKLKNWVIFLLFRANGITSCFLELSILFLQNCLLRSSNLIEVKMGGGGEEERQIMKARIDFGKSIFLLERRKRFQRSFKVFQKTC
jgi:hypothetical protein